MPHSKNRITGKFGRTKRDLLKLFEIIRTETAMKWEVESQQRKYTNIKGINDLCSVCSHIKRRIVGRSEKGLKSNSTSAKESPQGPIPTPVEAEQGTS